MHIHAPAFAPGLPAQYRLLKEQEDVGVIKYTVECTVVPKKCPHCGAPAKPWGSKNRVILDIPRGHKRVEFHIAVKRFSCTAVGMRAGDVEATVGFTSAAEHPKTFLQDLPAVSSHRSMTQRLVVWIGEQCRDRTFMEVAKSIGIVDATVRSVYAEHVASLEHATRIKPPESLALVRPRVMQRTSTAFLNVQSQTLVDIAPGTTADVVATKLQQLTEGTSAKRVSIDTVHDFRAAVQQVLPHALLFVDKPYVLALANDALLQARHAAVKEHPGKLRRCSRALVLTPPKQLAPQRREELQSCLAASPVLAQVYGFRQAMHSLYANPLPDPQEAEAKLVQAISMLEEGGRPFAAQLLGVLHEWRTEILAFFDEGAESGRVEVLGDLKHLGEWIEAQGRGHAFEALRAALLFPKRAPTFRYLTPGVSLERLKREAQEQQAARKDAA